MACPFRHDAVHFALKKCPFLAQIAEDHGETFARSVAVKPLRPASFGPVLEESIDDLAASFRLFHGVNGVVPLIRTEQPGIIQAAASSCPFHAGGLDSISGASFGSTKKGASPTAGRLATQEGSHVLSHAPLASLSSSIFRFLPGPGEFLARRRRRRREQDLRSERRKPASGQARGAKGVKASRVRSSVQRQPQGLHSWQQHPLIAGLIPLNAAGRLICPPAVVAARAAVARLKTVQMLRPQSMPIKVLGVGAQCFAANIPAGAIREHTEKFSLAWVVAVHATVPFFAFMRKGVGMPKWAIVLTLASAVAGQAIGARLERYRLALEAEDRACKAETTISKAVPSARDGRGCPLLKTCSEISNHTSLAASSPFAVTNCQQMTVA